MIHITMQTMKLVGIDGSGGGGGGIDCVPPIFLDSARDWMCEDGNRPRRCDIGIGTDCLGPKSQVYSSKGSHQHHRQRRRRRRARTSHFNHCRNLRATTVYAPSTLPVPLDALHSPTCRASCARNIWALGAARARAARLSMPLTLACSHVSLAPRPAHSAPEPPRRQRWPCRVPQTTPCPIMPRRRGSTGLSTPFEHPPRRRTTTYRTQCAPLRATLVAAVTAMCRHSIHAARPCEESPSPPEPAAEAPGVAICSSRLTSAQCSRCRICRCTWQSNSAHCSRCCICRCMWQRNST